MQWIPAIKESAQMAGKILESLFYKSLAMDYKGKHDIVTEADRASESIILEYLTEKFPDHKFISEEKGILGNANSDYVWYIDPLDGTTNFYHHIPYFNISIALEREGDIIAGLVYNPLLKELFYAEKGKGAYFNGKRISPATNSDLSKAFISACHGRRNLEIDLYIKLSSKFKYLAYDMRKLGSAGLELAYVASGKVDSFIGVGIKPWDFKAGLIVAIEAGCVVEGLYSKDLKNDGNLVVYSPEISQSVREIINQVVR